MPRCLCILLLAALLCASPGRAADNEMAKILPVPACGAGWPMDGKVALFDKETLSDRIDGEAELYFPYGFDLLAAAHYAREGNPQLAFDADVYRMGSLLDAFGMYANYRHADDDDAGVGAEGAVSPSQLFFYQGRYFVRLQATGSANPERAAFIACARAIARALPPGTAKPAELDAFLIPGVERKSVRYVAQSLLGYDFFRRGLMADALLKGEPVQLFLMPEDSPERARTAFEQYRAYLKGAGEEPKGSGTPDRPVLTGTDPLYGTVVVTRSGRFVAGAVRVKDAAVARQLVEQLRARVAP